MTGSQPAGAEQRRPGAAWLAFYLVLTVLCLFAIWRALGADGGASVLTALSKIPALNIAASIACIVGVFATILAMEQVALYRAKAPRAAHFLPGAALVANAVSLGSGFGLLSGGALRARLYASAGVDAVTAFYVASAVTLMSVLGGVSVAALGLTQAPSWIAASAAPEWTIPALIFGFLMLMALAVSGRRYQLFGREIELPRAGELIGWLALGAIDWLLSAAALYVLLPDRPDFLIFATLFCGAHLAAMATGAPNGLGVFDAIMIAASGGAPAEVTAALIVYRLTAFLAPVAAGLAGLAVLEAKNHGRRLKHRPAARGALVHALLQLAIHPRRARDVAPLSTGRLFGQAAAAPLTPLRELTGGGPVLVLAPHPDDEVLGCGGLIAGCVSSSTPVHVVYLTDGRRSHVGSSHWPPARLAQERRNEAIKGAGLLGLGPEHLTFLDLPDATLLFDGAARREAADALDALGHQHRFTSVFATWIHDPHPDHVAAALLARDLCTKLSGARRLSYPIWGRFLPSRLMLRDRAWRGLRLDVRAQLAAKKAALDAHRTQMTTLVGGALISMRAPWRERDTFLTGDELFFE
ncbi:MAG: PIG-L family deacetylase [Hyphomonadaceae bacterium]|nr:PIG-L family deacetylase [Hyphomonadaceae bacterium]